jgi:hypothetical protein
MTMTHLNDHQIGGDHYASKAVQPWQAMGAWMSREAFAGFLHGNCIKYLARYKDKNGIEDLKKCQHYLSKLIDVESNEISVVVDRHQFEAGRQSAINGGQINSAFRATAHKDWLAGYDQAKEETND